MATQKKPEAVKPEVIPATEQPTEAVKPEVVAQEPMKPTILDKDVESVTDKTVFVNENGVELTLSEIGAKTMQKLNPKAKFLK